MLPKHPHLINLHQTKTQLREGYSKSFLNFLLLITTSNYFSKKIYFLKITQLINGKWSNLLTKGQLPFQVSSFERIWKMHWTKNHINNGFREKCWLFSEKQHQIKGILSNSTVGDCTKILKFVKDSINYIENIAVDFNDRQSK